MEHTKTTDKQISRRTVLRTAAWSAPVITVMSAAPAFAVSGEVEGPSGGHSFQCPPGSIAVIVGGNGLITYYWNFKNDGTLPLFGVTFVFPTKGVKRWIPAAGLSWIRNPHGRGSAKKKAPTSGMFVHNGVVAPGQVIQFSVAAEATKKWRTRSKLVALARHNSTAIASADEAGSKPVPFNITSVSGRRRRRRGGHFSS